MTSYVQRVDPSVRAFLTKHGYSAEERLFHNVDYDAFMKLPDAMLQNLGLTNPSFIADRRAAAATVSRAQTNQRTSVFVADTSIEPTKNSTMFFSRRLDPDDDITDSESDEEYSDFPTKSAQLYRKDNSEDVFATKASRSGDRCCGGAHTKRSNIATQTRVVGHAPRPQSPSAYQTQHPGCYF